MRLASIALACLAACAGPQSPALRGIRLEKLTWIEAERVLTADTVVVLPLGAAAKEHGPHLTLENDFLIAEWLKERVLERCDVVVLPTLNYHFYPAFVEYPGSTTLTRDTARAVVVDVVRGLARFGPRRFYVLNTGVSTVRALQPAAEELAREGILLAYTNLESLAPIDAEVCTQERGTHADEGETSMMLVIAPDTVDMAKAVKDCSPQGQGGLSRVAGNGKTWSPSGVWGDATLATREKGERILAFFVELLVREIDALRAAPLP